MPNFAIIYLKDLKTWVVFCYCGECYLHLRFNPRDEGYQHKWCAELGVHVEMYRGNINEKYGIGILFL